MTNHSVFLPLLSLFGTIIASSNAAVLDVRKLNEAMDKIEVKPQPFLHGLFRQNRRSLSFAPVSGISFPKRSLDQEEEFPSQCSSDVMGMFSNPEAPLNIFNIFSLLTQYFDDDTSCVYSHSREGATVCDMSGLYKNIDFEGFCAAEFGSESTIKELEMLRVNQCSYSDEPSDLMILKSIKLCFPSSCDGFEDQLLEMINFFLQSIDDGEDGDDDFGGSGEDGEEGHDDTDECYELMLAYEGTVKLNVVPESVQCITELQNMFFEDWDNPLNSFGQMMNFLSEPDAISNIPCTDETESGVTACDLHEVFDQKFERKCKNRMNGKMKLYDMKQNTCDGRDVILQNIPFCMLPSCKVATATFFLDAVYMDIEETRRKLEGVGDFTEKQALVDKNATDQEDVLTHQNATLTEQSCFPTRHAKFQGTSGMQCFEDSLDMYGMMFHRDEGPIFYGENTTISQFSPAVLSVDFLENEDVCKPRKEINDTYSFYQCDFAGFGDMEDDCVQLGGAYKEVDLEITEIVASFHQVDIKIENVPLCISPSCNNNEDIHFFDVYFEALSQLDVVTTNSLEEHCVERRNDKFNWKLNKRGKANQKTCGFLSTRKDRARERRCSKFDGVDGNELIARNICPATCCLCKESHRNRFVAEKKRNESGERVATSRTCGWLSRQSKEVRESHCSKKSRAFGDLGPAYSACPDTCGTCA